MARVLTCPRCGQTHAGAVHSRGSTSLVCARCVPTLFVITRVDGSDNGKPRPAARRSRKKVTK